ncbi:thioredoxin family protein [bacterium]|nr:thioredoxin family protein [bacterium]
MLVAVDRNNFEDEVLKSSHTVLVNFWVNWSEACQSMRRLMKELDLQLDDQNHIVEINWDAENELARKYNVHGVPTLLIFGQGKLIGQFSGTFSAGEFVKEMKDESKRNLDLRSQNRLLATLTHNSIDLCPVNLK